jgi:Polyketide cyclase / dehydrase and lipid transport
MEEPILSSSGGEKERAYPDGGRDVLALYRPLKHVCRQSEAGIDMEWAASQQASYTSINVVICNVPAAKVFAALADAGSWPKWFPGFVSCVWTTPPPHGVGSKRVANLSGNILGEEFIVWEQDKRMAFRFVCSNKPIFNAGIEDFTVEALGDGSKCRFTYSVSIEPAFIVSLCCFSCITKRKLDATFLNGIQSFKQYIEDARNFEK